MAHLIIAHCMCGFFREGGEYFLQKLHDEKIPLLVFSAGIGGIGFCIL